MDVTFKKVFLNWVDLMPMPLVIKTAVVPGETERSDPLRKVHNTHKIRYL